MTVPVERSENGIWKSADNYNGKSPAEIIAICNALSEPEYFVSADNSRDPTRKEIYVSMRDMVGEVFRFASLEQAEAAVSQRVKIISMLQSMSKAGLAGRGFYWYPAAREKNNTQSPYWVPGRHSTRGFLFSEVPFPAGGPRDPFGAVHDICSDNRRTAGDCWGGLMACVWWGSSEIMKRGAFNALYQDIPLNMDPDSPPEYYGNGTWSRNLAAPVVADKIVPGDWCYFLNHNYGQIIRNKELNVLLPNTRNYYWQGENALYMGSGLFDGLGAADEDHPSSTLTLLVMRRQVAIAYDKHMNPVIEYLKSKNKKTWEGVDGEIAYLSGGEEHKNIKTDNELVDLIKVTIAKRPTL